MTRLQNAKKQLSEALAELESAVSQASNALHQANALERPSGIDRQNGANVHQSELVDEVSTIEAKLNEAIAIIAKIEADTIGSRTVDPLSINDRETQ